MQRGEVVRIRRYHYTHILDNNTNVTRCLVGPLVYTRKEHETCLFEPQPCVSVPAHCYCVIRNPHECDDGGAPVADAAGYVRLRMGDAAVRYEGEPFPLYPGEELEARKGVTVFKMPVIAANHGYHVRCVRDYNDTTHGRAVVAGMEWLIAGPQTYMPRAEVTVTRVVKASVVRLNTALRVRARVDFVDDRDGAARVAGDEWLVRRPGAYLPVPQEEVLGAVEGVVLGSTSSLTLRARCAFTDVYGHARAAGERWVVTAADAPVHIVDVHEEVMQRGAAVLLGPHQYCIVRNPVGGDGVSRYGEVELRRGEQTFFLQPDEELVDGVHDVVTLGKDEALLLKALSRCVVHGEVHEAGARWLLRGPTTYVPDVDVAVLERRSVVALDTNEGVYVMDTNTGKVRAVTGQPYMLDENEQLWAKQLPREVEELLTCPGGSCRTSERRSHFTCTRDKHRVVCFSVPHNAAVQLYDYLAKQPRIVLGPNLVQLGPHEEFTVLSLSGGKPKVPNAIQSLQLILGPCFSNDTVYVETSDHARLELRLSYNWYFDVDRDRPQQKIFSVPDFIGDCCKTIASRVRGAVAAANFDSFHRNSARIIRTAVFGLDEAGQVRTELRFAANDFVVTNVDIQSVEPTDAKTRDSLQKSVQLAIEITTKSQEAAARHGNELKDQEAKGQLERQKLVDKIAVEEARTRWLELQAQSDAVQASGQSVAEAQAKAEALMIEVKSELQQARLRAQAYQMSAESELKKLQQRQELEVEYTRQQNELEIAKERQVAEAEADKVRRMVAALGRETLVAVARAGPETQAKLLSSLGLKGYLITDGNSPVNLFSTAQGLIAEPRR